MKYEGGCHCRAIRYALTWPDDTPMPARRCTCSYCVRFNGCWTSHPDAGLEIHCKSPLVPIRYRFATASADFLICPNCGVVVAALSAQDSLLAVVNINTLDQAAELNFERGDSSFDGESLEQRLQRRAQRWIAQVRLD